MPNLQFEVPKLTTEIQQIFKIQQKVKQSPFWSYILTLKLPRGVHADPATF